MFENGFSKWWDENGNNVPFPEVGGLTRKGTAHLMWNAAFKNVESATTVPQQLQTAIASLGKWHRAYHDSRDTLENVDDETVKFITQQAAM
jgi:hypothetical protein